MALLEVEGLTKRFGAVTVADGTSFELGDGEALGIIGPNGAGKSSLFNLIGGNLKPSAGRIRYAGHDIGALPPEARCRLGIGRTYQIPRPFAGMTVFENLLVAAAFGGRLHAQQAQDHCARVLDSTGLRRRANDPAGSLTLLERKRLELARALAGKPRLLLLDEIAGGLTEGEARELVHTVQAVRAEGVALIWIEHVVHALLAVVQRLMVIDFGKRVMDGEPQAVMGSAEVKRIYLGIEA
jgi:branched-chain amino acid transport system ATP-binding protein